jgi:hypothetical protein
MTAKRTPVRDLDRSGSIWFLFAPLIPRLKLGKERKSTKRVIFDILSGKIDLRRNAFLNKFHQHAC